MYLVLEGEALAGCDGTVLGGGRHPAPLEKGLAAGTPANLAGCFITERWRSFRLWPQQGDRPLPCWPEFPFGHAPAQAACSELLCCSSEQQQQLPAGNSSPSAVRCSLSVGGCQGWPDTMGADLLQSHLHWSQRFLTDHHPTASLPVPHTPARAVFW